MLEIGCGIGTDTVNFARAGAEVTAVDVSSRSLDLARRRAEIFGVEHRIQFVEADAEQLSSFVRPQPYDLVYSFGVIHHSPRPHRILAEVRRHFVDSNSTLKLMLYHRRSLKVLGILVREARGAWWRLDDAIARLSEAQTGCPVTYTYSKRGATALLSAAGFAVVDARVEHIVPYRIRDYIEYRYVKAIPFNLFPDRVLDAVAHRLGWHLCLTAKVADAI